MENEREEEPLTIYLSGSEGAETRLNLSDVSLNFMRFFIHLSFNYYIYPIYFLLLAIFFWRTVKSNPSLIYLSRTAVLTGLTKKCGMKNGCSDSFARR